MTALQSQSMDWFLYDNGLRHERVNSIRTFKHNFETNHLSKFTIFYLLFICFLTYTPSLLEFTLLEEPQRKVNDATIWLSACFVTSAPKTFSFVVINCYACSSTLALYFISTVTNRCSCTVSEWLCVNWKRYSSVYNGVSDPQVFKRTKRSCSKTVFCRVLYVNINFFFFRKRKVGYERNFWREKILCFCHLR